MNKGAIKIKSESHYSHDTRVGHRLLLRSERIVLLHSFKASNVLLRSFFKFLATYETQKNDAFFCVLLRSFLKNVKERKERNDDTPSLF